MGDHVLHALNLPTKSKEPVDAVLTEKALSLTLHQIQLRLYFLMTYGAVVDILSGVETRKKDARWLECATNALDNRNSFLPGEVVQGKARNDSTDAGAFKWKRVQNTLNRNACSGRSKASIGYLLMGQIKGYDLQTVRKKRPCVSARPATYLEKGGPICCTS